MVCCPCCELCLFRRYNKRWVVVNDDHLFYANDPNITAGKIVYFFDRSIYSRAELKEISNNAKKWKFN